MSDEQYTLHDRPLKVGDKVWSIQCKRFHIAVDKSSIPFLDLENSLACVHAHPHLFAWDEPPKPDLASISPPLCWIEGHPVRKGTALMTKDGYACVADNHCLGNARIAVITIQCKNVSETIGNLTFAIPPSTRPMKKVTVTVWINKYPFDYAESYIYESYVYNSEAAAKLAARANCKGQHAVTYEVEVPA